MNRDFLRKTIEVWQPLSDENLNEEDAREILENIAGFFETLAQWDRESVNGNNTSRNNEKPNTNT